MVASPRLIPSIEQLRQRPEVAALEVRFGRDAVLAALRDAAGALRAAFRDPDRTAPLPEGNVETFDALVRDAAERLSSTFAPSLRPVVNATGVIVHTNLGRAPLAGRALDRVREIAGGYANLEYDLAAGRRGRRDLHAEALLNRLTGAEGAVVVNNNAAATLLVLAALARGREVIISRAELVEIGGGFRVPDIMAQSGAQLREVGTTNRTRVSDYAAAIGDRTALILRVHPSNFRIEGFTERPDGRALVALARRFRVPIAEDLGSGNMLAEELGPPATEGGSREVVREPTVQASIAEGFDVVCFSGDKLLGGPQAGIVVGRRDAIDLVRRHPLMRALRVDKMTYAALEGTLLEYAAGRARVTVPVAAMLSHTPESIASRARALAGRVARVAGLRADLAPGWSTTGGGSAPGSRLATMLVTLSRAGDSADALEARLRQLSPPVIARIENDTVVLDLRTVLPDDDELLANLLATLAV